MFAGSFRVTGFWSVVAWPPMVVVKTVVYCLWCADTSVGRLAVMTVLMVLDLALAIRTVAVFVIADSVSRRLEGGRRSGFLSRSKFCY